MSESTFLEIRISGNDAEIEHALKQCLKESEYERLEPHRDIGTVVEVIKVAGATIALTRELLQLGKALKDLSEKKKIKAEVSNEDGEKVDLLSAKDAGAFSKLL